MAQCSVLATDNILAGSGSELQKPSSIKNNYFMVYKMDLKNSDSPNTRYHKTQIYVENNNCRILVGILPINDEGGHHKEV